MQKILIYGAILLCLPLQAQTWEPGQKAAPMPVSTETRAVVQKIIGDTLVNGQAYEYATYAIANATTAFAPHLDAKQ